MLRSGSSPVAYRIRYDVVDLENCRFEGSVEIDLICRARTDSITLHAKELHISAASVDGLIAATALEHNLTVVTRNKGDFDGAGVNVVDPFR